MAQEYWVKMVADGEEYGPYTGHQLKEYAAAGQVKPDSLVSLDHATWHVARRIKNLFPPAATATAPTATATAPRAQAAAPAARATSHPAQTARTTHAHAAAVAPATAHVTHTPHADHATHAAHANHAAAAPVHTHVAPAHVAEEATTATIQYGSPSTPKAVTPDKRYRGVMLFLYLTALLVGVAIVLPFIAIVREIMKAGKWNIHTIDHVYLIIPALVALCAVLLLGAGLLGIFTVRLDRLLFLAALLMAVLEATFTVITFLGESVSGGFARILTEHWVALFSGAQQLALLLTFPILCWAGTNGLRRARKSPDGDTSRSPWAPLGHGIALVALLVGLLTIAQYGKRVLDDRQYATPQPAAKVVNEPLGKPKVETPQMKHDAWIDSAIYAGIGVVLAFGGLLALPLTKFGRFLVILGGVGLMGYAGYRLISDDTVQWTPFDTADHIGKIAPMFLFALFATIILMRPRLKKTKAAEA